MGYLADSANQKQTIETAERSGPEASLRMEALARELEEAHKEMEAFAYSISHDLRAPLLRIDGFSHALEDEYGEKLDETGRNYLARVRAGAQKMGQMIDDLLRFSRLTREPMTKSVLNLTGIARAVVEELREIEPQRKIVVEIAEGMTASGDAQLMKVVVGNLLGNAWKFTRKKEEARISMSTERGAGEKIFCVRDNGAGFEMSYACKLFAPFQRLHGESEFDGTGIGLATVKRIVARHGGRVWATAEPDAGAAFFFTLESSR